MSFADELRSEKKKHDEQVKMEMDAAWDEIVNRVYEWCKAKCLEAAKNGCDNVICNTRHFFAEHISSFSERSLGQIKFTYSTLHEKSSESGGFFALITKAAEEPNHSSNEDVYYGLTEEDCQSLIDRLLPMLVKDGLCIQAQEAESQKEKPLFSCNADVGNVIDVGDVCNVKLTISWEE